MGNYGFAVYEPYSDIACSPLISRVRRRGFSLCSVVFGFSGKEVCVNACRRNMTALFFSAFSTGRREKAPAQLDPCRAESPAMKTKY